MKNTESIIYSAIVGECERLEAEDQLDGNGHHLAQRLAASAAKALQTHLDAMATTIQCHLTAIKTLRDMSPLMGYSDEARAVANERDAAEAALRTLIS